MAGKIRAFHHQMGFTLIEVLVAVVIIATIGIGAIRALDTNYRATRAFDERVTATNLATAYLEAVKALPYAATYPTATDNITLPAQYSLGILIEFSSDFDSSDGITWVGSYSGQNIQKITVTVSREGGRAILSLCAFKTKRAEA